MKVHLVKFQSLSIAPSVTPNLGNHSRRAATTHQQLPPQAAFNLDAMPKRKADLKNISKKCTKRASLNQNTLSLPAATSLARGTQQYRHETLRMNHPYRNKNDITPDNFHLFRLSKTEQANLGSAFTDQLSHPHHAVRSNLHVTNTHANSCKGLGNEYWQALPWSVDHKVEHIPRLNDQFSDATRIAPGSSLLRWAYETSNANITLAERLEKSNWESSKMVKL